MNHSKNIPQRSVFNSPERTPLTCTPAHL